MKEKEQRHGIRKEPFTIVFSHLKSQPRGKIIAIQYLSFEWSNSEIHSRTLNLTHVRRIKSK